MYVDIIYMQGNGSVSVTMNLVALEPWTLRAIECPHTELSTVECSTQLTLPNSRQLTQWKLKEQKSLGPFSTVVASLQRLERYQPGILELILISMDSPSNKYKVTGKERCLPATYHRLDLRSSNLLQQLALGSSRCGHPSGQQLQPPDPSLEGEHTVCSRTSLFGSTQLPQIKEGNYVKVSFILLMQGKKLQNEATSEEAIIFLKRIVQYLFS